MPVLACAGNEPVWKQALIACFGLCRQLTSVKAGTDCLFWHVQAIDQFRQDPTINNCGHAGQPASQRHQHHCHLCLGSGAHGTLLEPFCELALLGRSVHGCAVLGMSVHTFMYAYIVLRCVPQHTRSCCAALGHGMLR